MSFFDKLTGVGPEEEEPKESASSAPAPERRKKEKGKKKAKSKKKEEKMEPKKPSVPEPEPEPEPESEGQLAIDVYESNGDFIIQSTIAGVKAEDLDISIENDLVTIRGSREKQTEQEGDKYYYQECYWGAFARQVILPEEVDGSKAEASMKDGVLTLKIPKLRKTKKKKIAVKQEE